MKPLVYKVIFEGDVMPGFGQLDVQKKLGELFAIDMSATSRLFMDKQLEVKRGVSLEQAKRHVRAMARIGAITYLIPCEDSQMAMPAGNGDGTFTDSGSFQADAFTAYFERKLSDKTMDIEVDEDAHEIMDPDATIDVSRLYDAEISGATVQSPESDEGTHEIVDPDATTDISYLYGSAGSGAVAQSAGSVEDSEITDVSKVKAMQEITRKMLAQKKLYE